MGVCKFKTEDVKRCVVHALQSKEWRMGYDDEAKPVPALLFVHDHGVYCMSNGIPRDVVDEKSCFQAFAKGCDPTKDENFYDEADYLVGGDDFVEVFPVNEGWLANCDKFAEMEIRVNTRSMSVVFKKPRLKKAV